MAVKYQISFNDVDGNACNISFDFADWTGPYKDIEAAGQPLVISKNGSRDNLFQQIVDSKATIHVIAQEDFINDTRDIDDREVSVIIDAPAGKWLGYLISYQRTESLDSANYELELTCVDPFSYIKENTNRILSGTLIMGAQKISTIITAILGLPIKTQIGYTPLKADNSAIGDLFDLYILVETFMSDGLLKNGADIISSICDLFNCTSFIENGVIYFRQPRALLDSPVKEIGFIEDYPDFIINDNEEVTRTKAVIQLGVNHEYGDIGGNIVPNNFFYYFKPTNPVGTEISYWIYRIDTSNNVKRSLIQRANSNGIFINGLTNPSNTNEIVSSTWQNRHDFMSTLSDFVSVIDQPDTALQNEYYLRLKYRYHRYALSRTANIIKYAFRVFAVFSDGSQYTCGYDGDGGRDKTHGVWQTNSTPSNLMPYISFPLNASNSESTFELKITCKAGAVNFPINKGDFQFLVVLYPISSDNSINPVINDYIPDSINITEVSIMPNVFTMGELTIDRSINPAWNKVDSALYISEQSNILSNRKFKTVNDPVSVIAGRKISEGADATANNPHTYNLRGLDGVLMSSGTRGNDVAKYKTGSSDPLVTLNAKDRMYFLRGPRNQITLDIRSSTLKFSDVLSFPGYVEGKYLQMESEYRVMECEHTVTVQELTGSDEADIIENLLSSE